MTPEKRELYGRTFEAFATALNGMQSMRAPFSLGRHETDRTGRASTRAEPRGGGPDAEETLRVAREKSDSQQDALRLQLAGLS